jgi:hypothetical protein
VDVLCADIYTGSFKELDLPHGNIDNDRDACRICNPPGSPPGCPTHWDPVTQSNVFSYDAQCMANVDANWAAYWNNVQTTLAELRREVLADIPLYELRSLMNALYSLANPAPDLTENQQRIAKKFWGDLCLDIQNGNLAPGAPVWMWPCTGSGNAAQRWHYDPATETIVNPTSSLCIDVQLDANTQRLEPVLATCNGADSQRWSYDPTQSVLYSGAGSTTVLRAGAAQGDFPYLDWKDETPGSGWPHFLDPFWLADAVNPCVEQSPLSRDVDSCVDQICGAQVDPYCCDNGWDDQCVDEVGSVCGQYCPPPL